MSLASKFPGKCKVCGTSWKPGETIHKNPGWTTWCANLSCTQGSGATPKSTSYKQPAQSGPYSFDQRRQQILAEQAATPVQGDLKEYIQKQTDFLWQINQEVTAALLKQTSSPNPAMIGQFTKIIYDELKKGN